MAYSPGDDKAKRSIIITLNVARVKCLARIALLEGIQSRTDAIETDQDNWERTKDHIMAALSFLNQTRYEKADIQLELPWD